MLVQCVLLNTTHIITVYIPYFVADLPRLEPSSSRPSEEVPQPLHTGMGTEADWAEGRGMLGHNLSAG